MVDDFKKVNQKDLISDTFNSKVFEKFINKFLEVDNKHLVAKILTEFSKLSVIGNNKLDTGLSFKKYY